MELMPCGLCKGRGAKMDISGEKAYCYCMSCSLQSPLSMAICGRRGVDDSAREEAVQAWNDLQSKLARLAYLEAMLQSQDAAAGKKTGGRL